MIEAVATAGEGDVEVHRVDLTANLAGTSTEQVEKRRKLRALFTD